MTHGNALSDRPRMELLAPAGTLPAFEAALEQGADAVYIGAPGLNARALARDFTFAEIAAMTRQAHAQGKKLYVAMNSLMKEDEVRLALETLSMLAAIGPDALILQDLGIFFLVRRFFPHLEVHASTLMTVNNSLAANYLGGLGFRRIVLARELSLAEIAAMQRQCTVDLEIFIHGAMCFSYSGLCRFSSLHGGKSSLRGQCVQPCRRRYDWLPSGKHGGPGQGGKGGGYVFSMNDLSGIDCLAEARDAGVVSLKIEGRLKSVAYVGNTVRAYRLALDALDAAPGQRAAMMAEAYSCLDAAMGRKRSTGFLIAGGQDRLIMPQLSGSAGEVIGKVTRIEEQRKQRTARTLHLQVSLRTTVRQGDRLRLYEERGGERKSFTLRHLEHKGVRVEQASTGQTVAIVVPDVEAGIFRQPGQGILFRVDVSGRMENRHSALSRKAGRLTLPPPDPIALERMLSALAMGGEEQWATSTTGSGHLRQNRGKSRMGERAGVPEWWLKVPSLETLSLRAPLPIARVVLDLNPRNLEGVSQRWSRKNPRLPGLVWALPPIIDEERLAWYRQAVAQLRQQGGACFQISHLGQMALFAGEELRNPTEGLEVYGDYCCNALNSPAVRMYAASGLAGVQFSLETDRANLAGALAHVAAEANPAGTKRIRIGLYVYGRPPLFSARLDAPHFQGQRTFASPRGERFYLDRYDRTVYAYAHAPFSLLHHVEELTGMGIDYLVVDLSQGQPKKQWAEIIALRSGRVAADAVFSGNFAGGLS